MVQKIVDEESWRRCREIRAIFLAFSGPHSNAHKNHVNNERNMLERFGGKNFIIKFEGSFKSGNNDCFVLEHVEHERPEVYSDVLLVEICLLKMASLQENLKQNDCPKLQIGCLNLSLNFSWISPTVVAGSAAGVASTLVCHPLEVLKRKCCESVDFHHHLAV